MNDTNTISHLRNLVNKFKEKEQSFINALLNKDLENPVFEEIESLVSQIKEELGEHDVLKIDDLKLRNELCAIRDNKDFKYFKILDYFGIKQPWRELSDEKRDELLAEIFSRVYPSTLMVRKMEIGSLLVGKHILGDIEKHLGYIKECYIFGFEFAAAIYCRTILEESIREWLKAKPEFSVPQRRKDLEKWPLDWLLNHLKKKKYFYGEVIEKAYIIKENVNHIIHPTSAKQPKIQLSPFEIIKDTFYILEMLFC